MSLFKIKTIQDQLTHIPFNTIKLMTTALIHRLVLVSHSAYEQNQFMH